MSQETTVKGAGGQFVHLHNHSHYSLLDGLQKVPALLDRVQSLGMSAVALTDHGNLGGAVEFYKQAKQRDIKPIIGVETYVAPRSHTDKAGRQDMNPYHLILLAYNQQGYLNLMKLTTIAQLEGFYAKPRVDRALLEQYHDGLIAMSACASGEVASNILDGNMAEAESTVRWYAKTFGEGNYYLELQDHAHQWEPQARINEAKIELSKKTGVPLVLTADSHYSVASQKEVHEILLCVQTGKQLDDPTRMSMEMDLFITDPKDIASRWSHMPEVMENTVAIADRCSWELKLGEILIPTFDTPNGETERDYLHQLCWQGAMWRYGQIPKEDIAYVTPDKAKADLAPEVVSRIEYELSVIAKMGYDGYFLIVSDFVNWGKNQGIIIGPGRGSAAGSIVAYCMNITNLDPLKYNLLFERFLNPDRVSMPDIDLDFQDDRRGEVIDYVTEKYGQERVAQIITFGTMAARNAVRDTGRVLGMSYADVDAIAKIIPQPIQGRHIPLSISIKEDPELKKVYTSNPQAKRLIDLATQIEGTIRSNGVHAAGVIIAPEPIVNYTPLQRAQKGGIATQYSMGPVEELGLLKMDFLGLSNLTIIKNALRIIRKVHGKTIDIEELPLDDESTYQLLARGDTAGVFQFESPGMKRYLRELKPTNFDDIIAMVALYRPGPMAELPRYIEGKNDHSKITYPHPSLKGIFEDTYGVMVYQEQVTAMLQLIAGYTPGQADLVRKAIGKKKRDIMDAEYPKFVAGCQEKGVIKTEADTLWTMIQPFADYSFNKSHAACYALIAYQTAYLKAHFPAAFMAALMTSDYGNTERIAIEVAECRRMGITVLPPDVNESFLEFGVVPETGSIRFGLSAIKNIGTGAIEAILAARKEGGPFASVEDLAKRVNARECNKKVWDSLIRSGAFDTLGERATLLHNLDLIVSYAAKAQKNALSGQIDIFGSLGAEENLPVLRFAAPVELPNTREQLSWERELLGLYLSHHPLDDYAGYLADTLHPLGSIQPDGDGKLVQVGGMITTVRRITTRNNQPMAFVKLEDKTGEVELVVFPKVLERAPHLFEADQIIQVSGKVSARDREGRITSDIKIIVDGAHGIDYDAAKSHKPKRPIVRDVKPAAPIPAVITGPAALQLRVSDLENQPLLIRVREILTGARGESEVYLLVGSKRIRLPFKVEITPELMQDLTSLVGPETVDQISV